MFRSDGERLVFVAAVAAPACQELHERLEALGSRAVALGPWERMRWELSPRAFESLQRGPDAARFAELSRRKRWHNRCVIAAAWHERQAPPG